MLENLRRKSLVKTYNDPIHFTKFEHGHVIYGIISRFGKHTQRFSKEKNEASFPSTFDVVFPSFVYTYMESEFSMIYCPSGTFTMGHKDQDDNPPRLETIERPFLLGETEVTQKLYEKVMRKKPSFLKNKPENPVEKVSWVDAICFCNELSRLQGLDGCYTEKNSSKRDGRWHCDFGKNGYRLPKEKEWEYAAKAGTNNRWAGTDNIAKLSEYAVGAVIVTEIGTQPVKTKKPNDWGFYDMSGNVWEWCWDKYDPKSKITTERVIRGGSWNSLPYPLAEGASLLCSAYRNDSSTKNKNEGIGFRVCRSIVN